MTAKDHLAALPESPAAPDDTEPASKPAPAPAARAPKIIEDTEAPDPAETEREEAFSDVPTWNGLPLEPWSFTRESIFYSQRTSLGAPPIDAINADLTGFLADAARILWLCSMEEEEIQAVRSRPETMQRAIDQWAAEALPPEKHAPATLLALQIHNRAAVNRPAQVEDGSPAGN